MSETFTKSQYIRAPRPRSERLRKLGGTASAASGQAVIPVTSDISGLLGAYLPKTNVISKGSVSVPVYFDQTGVAQPVTRLDGALALGDGSVTVGSLLTIVETIDSYFTVVYQIVDGVTRRFLKVREQYAGLYTDGELSAGGLNAGGGGGGGTEVYWNGTVSSGKRALVVGSSAPQDVVTDVVAALGYTPADQTALSSYLTTSAADSTYQTKLTTSNKLAWNCISAPTTISGYGITNAYTKTETDSAISTAISTALSGYATETWVTNKNYAVQGAHNNLLASGNEFTFASNAFSGFVYLNYRTAGGTNGNITDYYFGNGKGGALAKLSDFLKSSVAASTYLPLDGGNITGSIIMSGTLDSTPFAANFTHNYTTGWARSIVGVRVDGTQKFSIGAYGEYTAGASNNGIRYAYIGCNSYNGVNLRFTTSSLKWGDNDIYHAGNANKTSVAWSAASMTLGGHLYLTGANESSSLANTTQVVFGTSATQHVAVSCIQNAIIINPTASSTTGQLQLGVNGKNTWFISTGNFGIKTSSPSTDLDVRGQAAFNSGYFSNSHPTKGALNVGTVGIYGVSANGQRSVFGLFSWLDTQTGQASLQVGYTNGTTWDIPLALQPLGGNVTCGGNFIASGEVTAGSLSDRRFKDNVRDFEDAMGIIRQLRPVTFDWNGLATSYCAWHKGSDFGLIAQEVAPVLPSVISPIYQHYMRVDYSKLSALCIAGLQEHNSEIEMLKLRVEELENKLRNYEP